MRTTIRQAAALLERAHRIALCVHMFPDGDALGSMTALALALKKMGKHVAMFVPSDLPKRYSFFSLYRKIRRSPMEGERFDLAVALDCASPVQLGDLQRLVFAPAAMTMEIDHHSFRTPFTRASLIDSRAAAVGEMIYALLKTMRQPIDRTIAQAILISLVVETGSFRLPSVTERTFTICADLLKRKVNYYALVEKSYWRRTKSEILLLGLCLSRLKFLKNGRLAVSYVRQKDLRRFRGSEEDIDPIADQIRRLKDVRIVILLREMNPSQWRVSLRSKGRINVGRVAEMFGGGGHDDVAGCFLPKLRSAENRLIRGLEALLK